MAFDRLVFVDETGTTTSMTRLRGWSRKDKPLLGKAPHGHWDVCKRERV